MKLTLLDTSCLGADRFNMFPHAFPNSLELTDSSSQENRRGIADGYGSNVCKSNSDTIDQPTTNYRQSIRLRDPASSLPQSENKGHNLSVLHHPS
jgi:hypothetical protein